MRSQRGDFKNKIIVRQHAIQDAQAKEYNQRPEVKERNRKRKREQYYLGKGKERRRKRQPSQKPDAHQRKLMRQMGVDEWSRLLEEKWFLLDEY